MKKLSIVGIAGIAIAILFLIFISCSIGGAKYERKCFEVELLNESKKIVSYRIPEGKEVYVYTSGGSYELVHGRRGWSHSILLSGVIYVKQLPWEDCSEGKAEN